MVDALRDCVLTHVEQIGIMTTGSVVLVKGVMHL